MDRINHFSCISDRYFGHSNVKTPFVGSSTLILNFYSFVFLSWLVSPFPHYLLFLNNSIYNAGPDVQATLLSCVSLAHFYLFNVSTCIFHRYLNINRSRMECSIPHSPGKPVLHVASSISQEGTTISHTAHSHTTHRI